jgi:hypothetical protein
LQVTLYSLPGVGFPVAVNENKLIFTVDAGANLKNAVRNPVFGIGRTRVEKQDFVVSHTYKTTAIEVTGLVVSIKKVVSPGSDTTLPYSLY